MKKHLFVTLLTLATGLTIANIQAMEENSPSILSSSTENQSEHECTSSSTENQSEDECAPSSTSNNNSELKKEFIDILVEIKGIQRACQMQNCSWEIPRRFKGMSQDQLISRQKKLIIRMRELNKLFTDKEFNEIQKEANQRAAIETEITCDAMSGCAQQ